MKTYTVCHVRSTGEVAFIDVPNTNDDRKQNDVSLAAVQKLVGGHIEFIYINDDFGMYVNENGLDRNLPPNPLATAFLFAHCKRQPNMVPGYLTGDVYITHRETTPNGHSKTLTPAERTYLENWFKDHEEESE